MLREWEKIQDGVKAELSCEGVWLSKLCACEGHVVDSWTQSLALREAAAAEFTTRLTAERWKTARRRANGSSPPDTNSNLKFLTCFGFPMRGHGQFCSLTDDTQSNAT